MSETFKIHLQGTSDTQQWLKAEGQLRKLDSAANDFISSLKQGVGIDLGGKLVNSIAQLPNLFTSVLQRGYEFNKTMAQSEGGLANILGKFMKIDAVAAKQEAGKAMAAITEWEPKAAGSLQDLTQGFMATVGAGQAAGISVEQNVELVGKFANALAALGMDASQLTQELRAIFTGNITPDAQLAKTLEITPQAVKAAKDAGTFYEFLNKQLGALGDAAAGPAVVLSSLQSVIDKAAGVLAKPLFEEIIRGAEELTRALDDPAIKEGLTEAGISIGALTRTGVQLTLWAVENAPALLRVADMLFKVGAAVAAIKLTEIVAGLVLKAARWGMVTKEIVGNTAALGANAAAQNTAASAGGGLVKGAGAAGTAGGKALGGGMVTAFKGIAGVGLQVALLAAVSYAMDAAMKYIEAEAAMASARADESTAQDKRFKPLVQNVTKAARVAVTPEEKGVATSAAEKSLTVLEREKAEVTRQMAESRKAMAEAEWKPFGLEEFNAAKAAVAAAEAELQKIDGAIAEINGALGKMNTEAGAVDALKNKTQEASAAQAAFNAALISGQAAAGDNAAQIKLASDSVDALVKKLEAASGAKLDSSSFESLVKSIQGIDTSKLDDDAAKNVAKLIEEAGKLRDLKNAAADEENQMRDDAAAQAKQNAEAAIQKAEELRQKKIEQLELDARVAEAEGKPADARKLRVQAEALTLEGQGLTPEKAAKVATAEAGKDDAAAADRTQIAQAMADLEDKIAAARARGDTRAVQQLEDRVRMLQLARDLEENLGLTRQQAEARAMQRVGNERLAQQRDEQPKGAAADKKKPRDESGGMRGHLPSLIGRDAARNSTVSQAFSQAEWFKPATLPAMPAPPVLAAEAAKKAAEETAKKTAPDRPSGPRDLAMEERVGLGKDIFARNLVAEEKAGVKRPAGQRDLVAEEKALDVQPLAKVDASNKAANEAVKAFADAIVKDNEQTKRDLQKLQQQVKNSRA